MIGGALESAPKDIQIPVVHGDDAISTEIRVSWPGCDSRRRVLPTPAVHSHMLASPNLRCLSQVAGKLVMQHHCRGPLDTANAIKQLGSERVEPSQSPRET